MLGEFSLSPKIRESSTCEFTCMESPDIKRIKRNFFIDMVIFIVKYMKLYSEWLNFSLFVL